MRDFIEDFIPAEQLHSFIVPSFYFLPQKVDEFFSLNFNFKTLFSSCKKCFIHITSSFPYLFITTVEDTHIHIYALPLYLQLLSVTGMQRFRC